MPPTASRSTHGCGRRVRQKGRAGARKQLSSSSDSNEKRLDRRLILEEEKIIYEDRLERCRQKFEEEQAKIMDIQNRKDSLRSLTCCSGNDSRSNVSVVIVPLPLSISSASTLVIESASKNSCKTPTSIDSQHASSMSSSSSCSASNNKEINSEAQQITRSLKRQLNKEKAMCRKKAQEHNQLRHKFKEEQELKTVAWSTIDKIKSRTEVNKGQTQSLKNENEDLVKCVNNQSMLFKKTLCVIGDRHESDVNSFKNEIEKLEENAVVETTMNKKKLIRNKNANLTLNKKIDMLKKEKKINDQKLKRLSENRCLHIALCCFIFVFKFNTILEFVGTI